jgi:hypothetical protein
MDFLMPELGKKLISAQPLPEPESRKKHRQMQGILAPGSQSPGKPPARCAGLEAELEDHGVQGVVRVEISICGFSRQDQPSYGHYSSNDPAERLRSLYYSSELRLARVTALPTPGQRVATSCGEMERARGKRLS